MTLRAFPFPPLAPPSLRWGLREGAREGESNNDLLTKQKVPLPETLSVNDKSPERGLYTFPRHSRVAPTRKEAIISNGRCPPLIPNSPPPSQLWWLRVLSELYLLNAHKGRRRHDQGGVEKNSIFQRQSLGVVAKIRSWAMVRPIP